MQNEKPLKTTAFTTEELQSIFKDRWGCSAADVADLKPLATYRGANGYMIVLFLMKTYQLMFLHQNQRLSEMERITPQTDKGALNQAERIARWMGLTPLEETTEQETHV